MHISEADRKQLKQHPATHELEFTNMPYWCTVAGKFNISAIYDEEKDGYILYPDSSAIHKYPGQHIVDSYDIAVYFPQLDTVKDNCYRNVKETWWRIAAVARKLWLSHADLHLNQNGSLCITGVCQEDLSVSPMEFFLGVLTQFFYDQSFFAESNGLHWPRGGYSHGTLGILESYALSMETLSLGSPEARKLTTRLIDYLKVIPPGCSVSPNLDLLKILHNPEVIRGHRTDNMGWGYSWILRKYKWGTAFSGLWHLHKNIRRFGLQDNLLSLKQ